MKTSIKTLAYAAAVPMLLLSCNDFGTNSDSNGDPSTQGCSQYAQKSTIYYSYDVYDGPYDPAIVIIVGNVKDWMDEQLASGGTERRLIWISISDLPLINNPIEEPEISGSYNSETGESKWFVNGQEVTYDELKEIDNAWRQERQKLIEERISSYMASVHIPGEDVEIQHGGWKAFMTAEEIAELAENNEGLAISFWTDAPYMPSVDGEYVDAGGNGAAPPNNESSRCP